ncbi:O-methyltransferase [Pedobacter duraquae]|uniref:Putative O-methyltransferase YrrM n=1 Tax=Pedobacter duraquae TaxID=425511 RepID=A0A4R6IKR7_9SPHI|nr:class I SAM-dependent methyltransferase [Pedobacter duraquae]TDO22672.1 putative O-methyltransferase YrrM [Pedobacter duraquae]
MNDDINQAYPSAYAAIINATMHTAFSMSSDVLTCSLLRTLAAAKPGGDFLELGTGTGLSTAWILDGMDTNSKMISVDNDPAYLGIAQKFLGKESRLQLNCTDGGVWIAENRNLKFDFIFADTWHGKYLMLEEVLDMLHPGGFYILDDMLPQPNWPEGHQEKAIQLIGILERRSDLIITKQCWATGIVIAIKKAQA